MNFFLVIFYYIVLLFSISLSYVTGNEDDEKFRELRPGFGYEYFPKVSPETSNVIKMDKSLCSCRLGVSSRIVGGKIAPDHFIPWMASLVNSTSGLHYCGGTIINQRLILTSATCLLNIGTSEIRVKVGLPFSSDLDQRKHTHEVERVIPHFLKGPKPYQNNIGILLLKRKIDFKFHEVEPACLNFGQKLYHTQMVAGWGSTNQQIYAKPTDLNEAVPSSHLKIAYLHTYREFSQELGYKNKFISLINNESSQFDSPCIGDLGGPTHSVLYDRATIEGILTFLPEVKVDNSADIRKTCIGTVKASKLSNFKNWFEDMVGDNYCSMSLDLKVFQWIESSF